MVCCLLLLHTHPIKAISIPTNYTIEGHDQKNSTTAHLNYFSMKKNKNLLRRNRKLENDVNISVGIDLHKSVKNRHKVAKFSKKVSLRNGHKVSNKKNKRTRAIGTADVVNDISPVFTSVYFSEHHKSEENTSWLTQLRRPTKYSSVVTPGNTCRQFNWTETLAVQRYIQTHQNPVDCQKAKYLIVRARRSAGFAAVMTQLKNGLTAALVSGRILLFDSSRGWPLVSKSDCGNRTIDCLLKSISHCREPHFNNFATSIDSKSKIVLLSTGVNAYSKYVPKVFSTKDQFWWEAQAMYYLFKPRKNTFNILKQFINDHNWYSDQITVSLHLRSADRGKNYIGPLLKYTRSNEKFSKIDRVFVSTDDVDALRTLKRVKYEDMNRLVRGQHHENGVSTMFANMIFDAEEDRHVHVVQDILNDNAKNATRLTFEAIKNIAFLASGNFFIGTVASGFSAIAAAIGCVAGNFLLEPMQFGHWKKNQDPSTPPISSLGSTKYYVGPGLPIGARAMPYDVFNASDFDQHLVEITTLSQ